jgi:hypothetical protein
VRDFVEFLQAVYLSPHRRLIHSFLDEESTDSNWTPFTFYTKRPFAIMPNRTRSRFAALVLILARLAKAAQQFSEKT